MGKASFVMLAETYIPEKHRLARKWVSEKLDGVRCLWDGGVSRGLSCQEVPYANTEKHSRFVTPPTATGLWSRYGQPIQAPDWFLDHLPTNLPLDGELWLGRGLFQETTKIVQPKVNLDSEAWREIEYKVFDSPPPAQLFRAREIILPIAQFTVQSGSFAWYSNRGGVMTSLPSVAHVQAVLPTIGPVSPIQMERLSGDEETASARLSELYDWVLGQGGEGLMLRANSQGWEPERVKGLLKLKPNDLAQARVHDFIWAERGKIEGMIGAIECEMLDDGRPIGRYFRLSGFTDVERLLIGQGVTAEYIYEWGRRRPGERVPPDFDSALFPRGSTITYAFRELTQSGLPKDPRFKRSTK